MISNRFFSTAATVTAASVALLMACSSTVTTGNGTSGTGGTSGTSGTGTSGTSGSGTSGSSGSESKFKDCSGGSSNTCTAAETQAYSDCVMGKCDATYTECFGSGYKDGNFGGACSTFAACTNACACNDTACYQACGAPPAACSTCLQKIGTCSSGCTAPACMSAGSSGSSGSSGGKTCDDLQTCCAAITDSTKKTQCETTYNAIKSSGDTACNAAYSGYASDCGG